MAARQPVAAAVVGAPPPPELGVVNDIAGGAGLVCDCVASGFGWGCCYSRTRDFGSLRFTSHASELGPILSCRLLVTPVAPDCHFPCLCFVMLTKISWRGHPGTHMTHIVLYIAFLSSWHFLTAVFCSRAFEHTCRLLEFNNMHCPWFFLRALACGPTSS